MTFDRLEPHYQLLFVISHLHPLLLSPSLGGRDNYSRDDTTVKHLDKVCGDNLPPHHVASKCYSSVVKRTVRRFGLFLRAGDGRVFDDLPKCAVR